MQKAKDDFDKRKSEIELYFNFLSKLDHDKVILHYEEVGVAKQHKLDNELSKILKANGFLLIYNLVESFCRNSLWEVLSAINIENLNLKMLSEDAQMLWIKSKVKGFKENANAIKLEKHIHSIAIGIITDALIDFQENSEFIDLSGNIDKRKIKELAIMYGFNPVVPPDKEKAGEDLLEIKTSRNNLAHGRITFADCGKSFSIPQIIKYKDNAVEYLESVMINIEDYIVNSRFRI
jgi:hypothetical protein